MVKFIQEFRAHKQILCKTYSQVVFTFSVYSVNLTADFPKKSQRNKWIGVSAVGRKGWVSLNGPKHKEIGSETETL